MEENKIYLLNQIDLNKIIYSKVNEMNDKKLIHIHYEKPGQKLLFQTPQLLNIFDIQKNQYFNQLILPLYDYNLKVKMLIKFLKNLDLKIINDAKKNKNEWFKNKSAIKYKSLIKNLYTSNSQSNHYSPTKEDEKYCENGLIKLKLTNGIKIIENENGRSADINLDNIKKNNYMRLIVELYAVWVTNDVFGIYLKPVMIEQIPNKVLNFIDEKDDITDVNYMGTEANSEDEYIDNNDLMVVPKKMQMIPTTSLAVPDVKNKNDNLNYKNNINNLNDNTESEDSIDNLKLDNNKQMFHFGLHNVNDDFFNRVKKDNKIVSILSELNSNNTKKKVGSLSEISSEIDEEEKLSPKVNAEVKKSMNMNVKENIKENVKENVKENLRENLRESEKVEKKKIGFNVNDIVNELRLSQNINDEDDEDDEDEEDEEDNEDDEDDEDDEDENEEDEDDEDDLREINSKNMNKYSETSDSDDIKLMKSKNNNNTNNVSRRR